MGVLYHSLMPPPRHVYHDGFSINDDRSRISFPTKNRSACYSRTASSLYNSFLLVICSVGHAQDTSDEWSLPDIGVRVKTLEGQREPRHKSNGPTALSGTASVQNRPAGCRVGTREPDTILTLIHRPRQNAREQPWTSLSAGDPPKTDSRLPLKPASLGGNPLAAHANTVEESIKDRNLAENHQDEQSILFRSMKDYTIAADVPLPPSPPLTPLSRSKAHPPASIPSKIEKRQRDGSDEDITQGVLCFKKLMSRRHKVKVSVHQYEATRDSSTILAEPGNRAYIFNATRKDCAMNYDQPPLTDHLEWLDVDWKPLTFTSTNDAGNPRPDIQVSQSESSAGLAEAQSTSLLVVPTTMPASIETHPSTDSFVPAIQKFNKLVKDCDAPLRFAEDASKCLANNQNETRCRAKLGLRIEDQPIVRRLLGELSRQSFDSDPASCMKKLLTLIDLAVCNWQRTKIHKKLAALHRGQVEQPKDEGMIKYLPQLLPYRPPDSTGLTVNQCVTQQANKPFDIEGDREGYLYVYWNEATFGLRKIGFTGYDVSKRLEEWQTDCKHAAVEQYRSPCKVRHAHRVEQLVHADLSDYRVFEPFCHGCFKSHIEWFRSVDLIHIIERIEAWTQWASEGPYEQIGGQWCLTSEGRDKMPMVTDPTRSHDPKVHVEPIANPLRRYNLRPMKGRKTAL